MKISPVASLLCGAVSELILSLVSLCNPHLTPIPVFSQLMMG